MGLHQCLHDATFWRLHGSNLRSQLAVTFKVRDAFGACVCAHDIKKKGIRGYKNLQK